MQRSETVSYTHLDVYKRQAYMEDSGCADIENANCRFLKKAKEDASKIENTEKCISTIKEAMKEAETAFSEFEQKKQEELQNIGYSKEKETSIRERIAELEVYQAKKQRIEESRLKRARLEAEKESNDKTIASCSENASEVKMCIRDRLRTSADGRVYPLSMLDITWPVHPAYFPSCNWVMPASERSSLILSPISLIITP